MDTGEIHVKVVSQAKPGREDDARRIAASMTEHCRSGDGVLHYGFFTDEAEHLVCLEVFRDSQAFLDHIPHNRYAVDFVDACDIVSTEVFGSPSVELRTAMDKLGAVYRPPLG